MELLYATTRNLYYFLISIFFVSFYEFYYQVVNNNWFNLLLANTFKLKGQLSTTLNIYITITGNAQDFLIYMVRPELTKGLY